MSSFDNVDVATAQALLATGALLLDVREDDEFAAGHAADARHVALATVPDEIDTLPRDVTIVCVCRLGGRSARAATFLAEQGFTVVNLEGGMVAWAEAAAPLTSDNGEPTIL